MPLLVAYTTLLEITYRGSNDINTATEVVTHYKLDSNL